MPIPFDFDFKSNAKDKYDHVYEWRIERIKRIRENPQSVDILKEWYKQHPADFITHWGMTYDPRNADIGLPTVFPFLLFPKQEEWINWTIECWHNRENGLTEKTREMGLSWLAISLSCTLCIFNDGLSIGFGSRLEEYVDQTGNPKSIFQKGRMFMRALPKEFRGGWDIKKDAPHMQLRFPNSGSTITGEGGDNIGRGDRKSLYFVDEASHIMRPKLIEASLASTTNCRQDISTPNGPANPFAIKRFSGKVKVFTYDWRADPRKDIEWYNKQVKDLDAVTVAQEIDINYTPSDDSSIIPSQWVSAAIGAAENLGIELTGNTYGAYDVADEGIDLNAFAVRKGIGVVGLKSWSGKGSNILKSVEKAFAMADEFECDSFGYDADGMGAGVRGDSEHVNNERKKEGIKQLEVKTFRGSGEIVDPDKQMVKGRTNKDFFQNFKAQAWWSLRLRFQETYRAVQADLNNEVYVYNKDDIISLSPDLPELAQLKIELSQPTRTTNTVGKIVINKAPEGSKSPNLADAVMILFAPVKKKAAGMFS